MSSSNLRLNKLRDWLSIATETMQSKKYDMNLMYWISGLNCSFDVSRGNSAAEGSAFVLYQ